MAISSSPHSSSRRPPLSPPKKSLGEKVQKNFSNLQSYFEEKSKQLGEKVNMGTKGLRVGVASVVGGILMGLTGGALYAQTDANSVVNETSSQILHTLGDRRTALDVLREAQQKLVAEKAKSAQIQYATKAGQTSLVQENETLKKRLTETESQLKQKKTQVTTLQKRLSQATTAAKKTTRAKIAKPATSAKSGIILGSKKTVKSEFKKPLITPSELLAVTTNVQKTLKPGMEIKVQSYKGGRSKVWVSYKGYNSAGFFADTPKHKNRLTPEGMKKWAEERAEFLSKLDVIEAVAKDQALPLEKPKTDPYLVAREASNKKTRLLLKNPKGTDVEVTLTEEDMNAEKLKIIIQNLKARSEAAIASSETTGSQAVAIAPESVQTP